MVAWLALLESDLALALMVLLQVLKVFLFTMGLSMQLDLLLVLTHLGFWNQIWPWLPPSYVKCWKSFDLQCEQDSL
jgi:hypothetical protein